MTDIDKHLKDAQQQLRRARRTMKILIAEVIVAWLAVIAIATIILYNWWR